MFTTVICVYIHYTNIHSLVKNPFFSKKVNKILVYNLVYFDKKRVSVRKLVE